MKLIIILVLSTIFLSQHNIIKAHPTLITITNISISDDSVKVIIKLQQNDIINALMHENKLNKLVICENNRYNNLLIEAYIKNHFKIILKDTIKLTYVKSSFDSNWVYIFIDAKIDIIPNIVSIENTLFSNIYGDPRNLVIVSYNKYEVGFNFTSKDTIQKFILK